MTREEALAYALRKKAGLESEINKSNCEYGKWVMYSAELDFTNACVTVLHPVSREQVEKVWRGEWQDTREAYNDVPKRRCSRCKNVFIGLDTPFCEVCGAPMTDEAVDMVMERWRR